MLVIRVIHMIHTDQTDQTDQWIVSSPANLFTMRFTLPYDKPTFDAICLKLSFCWCSSYTCRFSLTFSSSLFSRRCSFSLLKVSTSNCKKLAGLTIWHTITLS